MILFVVFVFLMVIELIYFKVADHYNIIDKPNERSSHSTVTLRGGGIIFYFSALIFFIYSGFSYPWFFLGLTLMTIISFLDDVVNLSNKPRLIIHFLSVILMAYQMQLFIMPWYYLIFAFIIVVGVINAYNFMDGINGITVCYSISICLLLIVVNNSVSFINYSFLTFTLISLLVFAIFNFRREAKTFAGDVGSVSIAFILIFALGTLILQTGNFIYILFLLIYGVDSVFTIIQRLIKRENIFEAHRSHLYQYLGNEAKLNKLAISFFYGLLQFLIGLVVILLTKCSVEIQIISSLIIIASVSIIYLITKNFIQKKYLI